MHEHSLILDTSCYHSQWGKRRKGCQHPQRIDIRLQNKTQLEAISHQNQSKQHEAKEEDTTDRGMDPSPSQTECYPVQEA